MLKQAAEDALKNVPDEIRKDKRWAEVEKELVYITEITEKERNAGKFFIKNEGEIDALKFSKIADRIKEVNKVDFHLIDKNNQKFSKLFKRWQKNQYTVCG